MRCLEALNCFEILPNSVSKLPEMFPSVFQIKAFAGRTFLRKITAETASYLKMQSVVFDHTRSQYVLKFMLFNIASFEYLNDYMLLEQVDSKSLINVSVLLIRENMGLVKIMW